MSGPPDRSRQHRGGPLATSGTGHPVLPRGGCPADRLVRSNRHDADAAGTGCNSVSGSARPRRWSSGSCPGVRRSPALSIERRPAMRARATPRPAQRAQRRASALRLPAAFTDPRHARPPARPNRCTPDPCTVDTAAAESRFSARPRLAGKPTTIAGSPRKSPSSAAILGGFRPGRAMPADRANFAPSLSNA